jgi:hypothetical protein
MAPPALFYLKVQKLDHTCLFELSWGEGQQLTATLAYPAKLTMLFKDWQQSYIGFYKNLPMPLQSVVDPTGRDRLRGRSVDLPASVPQPIDWQTKLGEAQIKLLNEFHRWLRGSELYEIRAAIARASREQAATTQPEINVFLTCTPIELARFPWEAWEIGTDFAATGMIQIVRTPQNRIEKPSPSTRHDRRRTRILAILGDETGLNFQTERKAIHSLTRIAEVEFVGWQPGQTATDVKEQISHAITDQQGWDVLFFAGHSNENQIAGGDLAIAPGASILINELMPQLIIAKERGLKFAIFNSCKGLDIAESLVSLGFNQVAVMREPIHNRVAEEFVVQFIRNLGEYKNVQESLLAACQFLRLEKNLTYPSVFLVPSLFCYPGTPLFQIPRVQPLWKRITRQVAPTRLEAIALTVCVVLALIPQVQNFLMDRRIWIQAIYRDMTGQVPPVANPPPVALVQIDDESISRDSRLAVPYPMNQAYLADLIDRLSTRNAKVIGIDYLLDRGDSKSEANTKILKQSIQQSVERRKTWFVFGIPFEDEGAENFPLETVGIAKRNWTLQGHFDFWPGYVMLRYPGEDCRDICPFAYLLSLIHVANQDFAMGLPQPSLERQQNLRVQTLNFIDSQRSFSSELSYLNQVQIAPIAAWADQRLKLIWFQPIMDLSIPPDRVYDRIAAWRLFDPSLKLPNLSQQIVIIASGGYSEAGGVSKNESDYRPLPSAMQYWQHHLPSQNNASSLPIGNSANIPEYLSSFTGGETHAYIIHHLLTQHLIIPVPDILMVGIAGLLGRGTLLLLGQQQKYNRNWRAQYIAGLAGITALYGLAGLQLYISAAILIPCTLPVVVIWIYLLPVLRLRSNG